MGKKTKEMTPTKQSDFNYKPKYPIQIALVSAGKEPNPDIFTCLMENGSCMV